MTTTPRDVITEEASRLRAALPRHSRYVRDYQAATPTRREALDDSLIWRVHRIAGPHLQSPARPTYEAAAALIEGAAPRDLAPELTRREAGQWVAQSEHATPAEWYSARCRERHPELVDVGALEGGLPVWRWVAGVLRDPARRAALLRTRTGMLGGAVVEGRAIDRLDELRPCDLSASVEDTLDRAIQRLARESWDGPDDLIPPEPWHDRLPEGVTVLRSATELYKEGSECRHCVGVYTRQVYERQCLIVRVVTPRARSTAQIVAGRVEQHRGPRNETPHSDCVALLSQCRWGP